MYQWWFFSCALGLATWAYLAGKDWRVLGARALLLGLAQLLVSAIVLTCGFLLEPRIQTMLDSGILDLPVGGELWIAFFSALVPAAVVIVSAREGKDRVARLRNAMAAAVITLLVLDNVWNLLARRPLEQFLFSLFSDAIGGAIAGLLIGLAAEGIRRQPALPSGESPARTPPSASR